MKINLQQLTKHLTEKIAPIYLISGDEFLLVQEACDMLRQSVSKIGYSERETFHVESSFNWENFLTSVNNSSLFSEHTLIELHLKGKISVAGKKILQSYAQKPTPDKIVLIVTDKLDTAEQKTSWFKAVDSYGIILPIWPIDASQLPLWLSKRLQQAGFKTDGQGIKLLADHTSGNLLAAAQEIEKLRLLYGSGNLTNEQIMAVIADNARFDVYNLIDTALLGKTAQLIRMLDNLKTEKLEPTIIAWAIARELRSLINIIFAMKQGIEIEQVMIKNNVWNNRKALVKKALERFDLIKLQNLLKSVARLDQIIKGADDQHLLWHELYRIYYRFAKSS